MAEYTLDDLKIGQVLEPTIKTEKLIIPNSESGDEHAIQKDNVDSFGDESKRYAFIPMIRMNKSYVVQPQNIVKFKMIFTDFIPSLLLEVADPNNEIKSKYYPTDGSIISVFIASIGDEKVYRPIRLDYLITNCTEKGSQQGSVVTGSLSSFSITAQLNVPKLYYRKNMFCSGTSYESLYDIAEELGLGFASNVDNTDDAQLWVNGYYSVETFMKDIARHAYLDDDSFFAAFIDPYYNLNFVEVSRLFSQIQENESCYAYKTVYYSEENSEQEYDINTVEDEDQDINDWKGRRHKFHYELNNSKYLSGWTPYYENYAEINSPGGSLFDGYVKYAQWWKYTSQEFIDIPVTVNNLNTEGMLPLNKGRLVDGNASELVENLKTYTFNGVVNDHMGDNYYYAEVNNRMNLNDMSKFGMTVELPVINPAITLYSRIKLIVFEKNDMGQAALTENPKMTEDSVLENEKGETLKLKDHPEMQSDTTPRFDLDTEEGKEAAKKAGVYSELATNGAADPLNQANETLNESLSGWYVVTGFEIYMGETNTDNPNKLMQKVYLSRREYKPALKSNYMDVRANKEQTAENK